MNEQIQIQLFLQKKFVDLKTKNPRYSMRSFSKRLGIPSGPVTEILKGQRRVSRQMVERIVDNLKLDPTERSALLQNFPAKLRRRVSAETLRLSSSQFQLISDWVHYAILSLMKTSGFKADAGWIAEKLSVKKSQVEKALKTLLELGLLAETETGWKRTKGSFNTTDDVLNVSIQNAHLQDMEMAKEKLATLPPELRDFSSYTFPANPALMSRAKEILRKAQDDLADLMAEADPQEVYRVCTYLYPLTKVEIPKESL